MFKKFIYVTSTNKINKSQSVRHQIELVVQIGISSRNCEHISHDTFAAGSCRLATATSATSSWRHCIGDLRRRLSVIIVLVFCHSIVVCSKFTKARSRRQSRTRVASLTPFNSRRLIRR